jgi:hypothetical protein
VIAFARHYELVMDLIVSHCGGSDKFAHTYIGLALWLAGALLLRRSQFRFEAALLSVIAIELANECVDRVAHGSWMWPDTLGDMAATWFWPTVLTVSRRWFPSFFSPTSTALRTHWPIPAKTEIAVCEPVTAPPPKPDIA